MKEVIIAIIFLIFSYYINAQNDGINHVKGLEKQIVFAQNPYWICGKNENIKRYKKKWLKQDIRIANQLNKILTFNKLTELENSLKQIISCSENCKSIDFGYEIDLKTYKIYGGYSSYLIEILHYKNKILETKITLDNYSCLLRIKDLQEKIKIPYYCSGEKIIYRFINQKNLKEYNNNYSRLYLPFNDSTSLRYIAIHHFMDYYAGSKFYEPYKFSFLFNSGHETFNYLRYFITNNDTSALEMIIFSPSKTSRLFAAKTLNYLNENSLYTPKEDILKRTNEILKINTIIKSGYHEIHSGFYRYVEIDINKDFEKLLKEI